MQRGSSSQLDYVLVLLGLALMVGYHIWLLLRIRRRPETTVIGINAINRHIWVRHIMEDPSGKHAVLSVQTLRNTIMASTVLASVAITLSSLVAALMAASGAADRGGLFSAGGSGSSSGSLAVGAGSEAALAAKFFAVLVCFLVAFLLNVQSIRYYSHTGLLVNVPLAAHRSPARAVGYVTAALNRGFYFWSLGVRAYYFSCPVFLWLSGPVPMCASCVAMVAALYFLDVSGRTRTTMTTTAERMKVTDKEETRPPCAAASEFKPCHTRVYESRQLEKEFRKEDEIRISY